MSHIDDLVRDLCPDGVPFRALRDIGEWFGGATPSKAVSEFWTLGTVPWLSPKDMTGEVVAATEDYITEAALQRGRIRRVPPGSIAIVVRSNILRRRLPTAYVPISVTLNQDMRAVVPSNDVLPQFLAQVLHQQAATILAIAGRMAGSMAAIESKALLAHRIPVPPMSIQQEIVKVLDSFQALEAGLEAELEAEVEARERQYEYYRDQLLRFLDDPETRWVEMGEFGTVFGGLTGKTKSDFDDGNAPYISYLNVFNNLAVDLRRGDRVRIVPGERQRALSRGDILFTASSETAAEVAMSSVVTDEPREATFLNSFCIGFRPNDSDQLSSEFAKHMFRSKDVRKQLVKTAAGVTRFNVSKVRLAKVRIPIPPLDDQRRIAGILDNFDAAVNELLIDLPTELKARRQQYAYYRERLLTFREAV